MPQVIGVRFRKTGKVYYFDPAGIEFEQGDGAVVETARGVECGDVLIAKRELPDELLQKPLKPVLRRANEEDLAHMAENRKREQQASEVCQEKIKKHNLDMKLISVEYSFDSNKIVFYFTADGRIDFRELVKDLAGIFKTRIELRQIGVRDEAKMLGGLGPCGRPACCASFLSDFVPVSIKMAKEQNLSLSPTKISGLCGRLMCCLNYEHEYYEQVRALMYRAGAEVKTPDGRGTVAECNALTERVKVRVTLPDETIDLRDYAIGEVSVIRNAKKPPKSEEKASSAPAAVEEEKDDLPQE